MAKQIGQVLPETLTGSALQSSKPSGRSMTLATGMVSRGITTQAECDKLRSLAFSLPASFEPATMPQITQHLKRLSATLPSKNIDEGDGQMRFVSYIQILNGYPNKALEFMVDRVLRTLDWFPTPRQCLEALEAYSPPVTMRDKALRLCENWTQEQFDRFVADLRDGPVDQSIIDGKPERWKRICVETGLLMTVGEKYVQRVKVEI